MDNQEDEREGRWKARARFVVLLLLMIYIGGYYALINGLLFAPEYYSVRAPISDS